MGMLILQDGSVIKGTSFGANTEQTGEIVFNTSMTGYQEVLSDPSYAKQIVVMTYPEIGNYGINESDFESKITPLTGFIVKKHCLDNEESHYQSDKSISAFLKERNIAALDNIDTRSLVKKIRETGCMAAYITSEDKDEDFIKQKVEELKTFRIKDDVIEEVSTKENYIVNPEGEINLAFIDYGAKAGIVDSLAKRGCKVSVFNCRVSAQEILDGNFDAVFLSNGPGDPASFKYQIEQIKELLGKIQIFGICLGYQLLALSSGATTFKLKYGHRGGNHPVINLENKKVLITSQNHGYAVDMTSLPNIVRATYKNLNDNTLEGFEISSLKVYALQFHPESNPGPKDASIIFDEWINLMKKNKKNHR